MKYEVVEGQLLEDDHNTMKSMNGIFTPIHEKRGWSLESLFDDLDFILAGDGVDWELIKNCKTLLILSMQNFSQLEALANWLRTNSPNKLCYVMGQAEEAAAIAKLFAGLQGEFIAIHSPNSRKLGGLKIDGCVMVLGNRFAIDQVYPLIKDYSIGSFYFYNSYGELRHITDMGIYSTSMQLLKSWSDWEWERQKNEKNRN